jgi:putative transposase
VLALHACAEESKDGWVSVQEDLRTRGATQIDLLVTDRRKGLLAAVKALFSATPRQRCLLHKQRNVLNAVPRCNARKSRLNYGASWLSPTKRGR